MSPEEFDKLVNNNAKNIGKSLNRDIPLKISVEMENFTKDNFRRSGFLNNGIKQWTPAKRIGKAKGANGTHKTLLSSRNHLYNSTHHRTEPFTAIVYNDCDYAEVHNEGLRAGRGKGFKMPRRQFMGESNELNNELEKIIDNEITKLLNL